MTKSNHQKSIQFFIVFSFFTQVLFGQESMQNIRGQIKDKETQISLAFGQVLLFKDGSTFKQVETDENGNYALLGIPIGRYVIYFRMTSYKSYSQEVILNSGKEFILNPELEQNIKSLKEVVVKADAKNSQSAQMMLQSVKNFTPEETERYAGSRADPARMASNFAGVQGNNDSRNDIVIRGNSPLGVFYLLDNVYIPNPSHFAISGSTGGPVSILNSKTIDNSLFLTGAFPPGYGNAISGGFDLKMRSGNNQKHEASAQFGILGTELLLEGPVSKSKRSSYMVTYRYSTLKLFEALKIKIGTDAVPNYQDAAFKLNFPINNKSAFSIFGIGGMSKISIVNSDKTTPPTDIYSEATKDQYFGSKMGVIGANYGWSPNNRTYLKFTLAQSGEQSNANHNLIYRDSNYLTKRLQPILFYQFNIYKTSFNGFINKNLKRNWTVKIGYFSDIYRVNYLDSFIPYKDSVWHKRWDYKGTVFNLMPYLSTKKQFNDKWTGTFGIHSNYFSLSKTFYLEPRASIKYQVNDLQSFSLGYGLHSQNQPLYTYYYKPEGQNGYNNSNIAPTRSHHFVAGYDWLFGQVHSIRIETYYQYLFNIPVDILPSSFSMINGGSSFSRIFPNQLINKGSGTNYGVELTYQKKFAHHYFLMFTGSLFNSFYKGSDGVQRSTDFNGNYAMNSLGGYEFKIKRITYSIGGKFTYTGGRRYSNIDTTRTASQGEIVYKDLNHNNFKFRDYVRFDLKFLAKINAFKTTHEVGIDIVNVFNTKNLLGFTYNPGAKNPIRTDYQLGLLPLFYYKLEL